MAAALVSLAAGCKWSQLGEACAGVLVGEVEVAIPNVADAAIDLQALGLMIAGLLLQEAPQSLLPLALFALEKLKLFPAHVLLFFPEIVDSILNQGPRQLLVLLLFVILLQLRL